MSPDCSYMISASEDSSMRLWTLKVGLALCCQILSCVCQGLALPVLPWRKERIIWLAQQGGDDSSGIVQSSRIVQRQWGGL